jgi:hypothetical protein
MLSLNCKYVQHVKIYLPCNFEVNPITHFDRLCKLEKRGDEIKKQSSRVGRSGHAAHFCILKLTFISYSFWNIRRKVLKFYKFDEKRAITPRWVIRFTSKFQGRYLTDPKGHVSYSHHLSSVVVVSHKLFQKSSPLKVLDQWKPNLVWIITRVSSFKIVSGDAAHQPTWPLLLKIKHGKIAGFG